MFRILKIIFRIKTYFAVDKGVFAFNSKMLTKDGFLSSHLFPSLLIPLSFFPTNDVFVQIVKG
jgi:hypothetical protein